MKLSFPNLPIVEPFQIPSSPSTNTGIPPPPFELCFSPLKIPFIKLLPPFEPPFLASKASPTSPYSPVPSPNDWSELSNP